jgi:hypothetical protein
LKVDRFDDIRVDTQFVTGNEVALFAGRGDHDHRDVLEVVGRAHLPQDFEAVHFGHLEVEHYHRREAIGVTGEFAAATEIVQGLSSVADDYDLIGKFILVESGECEFHVPLVVFSE